MTTLDQFHNENTPDSMLQQKLAAAPDQEQLTQRAVELGQELSLEFNEAEVLDSDYSGELDENELDAVAGGCWGHKETPSDRPLVMPHYDLFPSSGFKMHPRYTEFR